MKTKLIHTTVEQPTFPRRSALASALALSAALAIPCGAGFALAADSLAADDASGESASSESAKSGEKELYGDEKVEVDILADALKQAQADEVTAGLRADALSTRSKMIESQLPLQQKRSDEAARRLYKMQHEKYDIMEMLFSSQSFDEFTRKVDYLGNVTEANVREIQEAGQLKAKATEAEDAAQLERDKAHARVKAARSDLKAAQQERIDKASAGIANSVQQALTIGGANSLKKEYNPDRPDKDASSSAAAASAAAASSTSSSPGASGSAGVSSVDASQANAGSSSTDSAASTASSSEGTADSAASSESTGAVTESTVTDTSTPSVDEQAEAEPSDEASPPLNTQAETKETSGEAGSAEETTDATATSTADETASATDNDASAGASEADEASGATTEEGGDAADAAASASATSSASETSSEVAGDVFTDTSATTGATTGESDSTGASPWVSVEDAAAIANANDAAGKSDESEKKADEDEELVEATTDTSAIDDGADWSQSKEEFVAEWGPRIDAYLAGSPLYGQGDNFAKSAWKYCIDPRWSAAISNTESSKGAICIRPHNAWGWGAADSDPYNLASEWGSWEEAIDAHAAGLANGYGYTITMRGAQAYCPYTWQNWYNNTLREMSRI